MSDLAFHSASALAATIARREISCAELLDHYLRRLAAHNPRLNAVVTIEEERARDRAAAADGALARGESWGPLHGVPITVKDTLETAGLRTTAGFPPLTDHVPAANAVVVERLVRAGAIVVGKTNTPTMAGDWQTHNPIFGSTNNPWDVARTPGGSSGGSAAAIAAGLSALEIGSDIGGSIRIPAHWCGVYGHKPSHGIIPLRGHIPGPPGTLAEVDLGVVGPIARSPEDLGLVLELTAGPLPDRSPAWQLRLPPPRRRRLQDYRVAAWLDDDAFPVDAEVGDALHAAIGALAGAGVVVDERARPEFTLDEMMGVYTRLLWPIIIAGFPPDSFEGLTQFAERAAAETDDPLLRLARCGTERHRDWLAANEHREQLRARLADFFTGVDVLLMPAAQVAAIPHDLSEPQYARRITIGGRQRPYYDLFAWIATATALLNPATVAPIGRGASGLPIGIQIVAPYLEDRTAIDFAHRLAEVAGGFAPPPGF
jgi:amidase